MRNLSPLRPPQEQALADVRAAALVSKRIMLQAATGFGKTNLFCHMVHGALTKRKRVVFVVPAITLIDQTVERLIDNGVDPADIGVMQADHPWKRGHAAIQVATAQTLARRERPDCDLLVVDEAHEQHASVTGWMASEEMEGKLVIGLSATPWSKGLGKHYDKLVKTTPIRDLIEDGWLSQFRVFAPSHPDLSGVKTVAGDYHEGQLGERMSKPELVADIVSTWLSRARGMPTLCFCVNRAHAQNVAEQFARSGVKVAYVDMDTPAEERTLIGQRLARGDVEVVCNIGTLTKGVDWIVRCLILARPTKSDQLYVQILGRALRPEYAQGLDIETREGRLAAMAAGPKQFATILDHSDTTLRLGMVTDIDHDELDDGKPKPKSKAGEKEEKEKLPKECGECAGLIPYGAKECPCCGAVVRRPSHVEQREGELVELTPGSMKPRGKRIPVLEQLREMGERSIYGQLRSLQAERDKSDGWVAANFRAAFDKWPPREWQIAPEEPSYVLRSWIKARGIAYAKAMEAKHSARNGVEL